jgi:hypothetical protein
MASEGTGEAFGWLRCAAKSFCRVFSGHSQYTKKRIYVNGKVPTVYSTLIRAIVAEPFTRPVAPVAALHTADTRKIPAIVSRCCVYVHVHGTIEALGEWRGRLSLGGRRSGIAGHRQWRVVGGSLALEAHDFSLIDIRVGNVRGELTRVVMCKWGGVVESGRLRWNASA